jgi:hypothetical protein
LASEAQKDYDAVNSRRVCFEQEEVKVMDVSARPVLALSDFPLQVIDIGRIVRPFGFVSLANYFILFFSGSSVVGFLLGIRNEHSLAGVAPMLAAVVVYGFSAWVGWTNIGVLESVVHEYYRPSLLLLGLFSLYMALSTWPAVRHWDADREVFTGFFLFVMLAAVSFLGLAALAILHRLQVPTLGVNLRTFLTQNMALRQSVALAHHLPPARPWRGTLFGALGIGWLVGVQLFPENLIPDSLRNQLWQVSQIGWVLLIYARSYFQPNFATIRAADHRRPVVFLRSFAEDEKMHYQLADRSLFDFSLESRLAGFFSAIGPFIAVASPKEKLPQFGAVRAHLTDDEWQGTVVSWLRESSLVVVMVGVTPWIGWELKKVVDLSLPAKLIVMFPQVRRKKLWKQDNSCPARLAAVRSAFANTPWERGLADLVERGQSERIRSIMFHSTGRVTAVVSKVKNRESYHLAAILAYHLLQDHPAQAPAVAKADRRRLRAVLWSCAILVVCLAIVDQLCRNGSTPADSLTPLPPQIPVTSSGNLRAGNFGFVDSSHSKTLSPNYRAGDVFRIEYEIAGFGTSDDGVADLEIDTTLLDSSRAAASGVTHQRFHEKIHRDSSVRCTFQLEFLPSAEPGDYSVEVKIHDSVQNTSLEFIPRFHLAPAR